MLKLGSYFMHTRCSWLLLLRPASPCLPSREGFLTAFPEISGLGCLPWPCAGGARLRCYTHYIRRTSKVLSSWAVGTSIKFIGYLLRYCLVGNLQVMVVRTLVMKNTYFPSGVRGWWGIRNAVGWIRSFFGLATRREFMIHWWINLRSFKT